MVKYMIADYNYRKNNYDKLMIIDYQKWIKSIKIGTTIGTIFKRCRIAHNII